MYYFYQIKFKSTQVQVSLDWSAANSNRGRKIPIKRRKVKNGILWIRFQLKFDGEVDPESETAENGKVVFLNT